ncbi:hypothetical protein FMEXI_10672 [Fusarium mexicanum]|uniref:Uncharacterized protein n=1 Tax=Fusarium mexicanum TaxID=751941 RepID=A0A8H5IFC5_9HYPO|nr:hypothetical protein FMEXI_10672 [Fusarium mexicanum]
MQQIIHRLTSKTYPPITGIKVLPDLQLSCNCPATFNAFTISATSLPAILELKMSTNHDSTNVANFFISDNKRLGASTNGIYSYDFIYKYWPGDKVYIVNSGGKAGPYKVESADGGKYVLCDDYGITANGGQSYLEDELELYDPFA